MMVMMMMRMMMMMMRVMMMMVVMMMMMMMLVIMMMMMMMMTMMLIVDEVMTERMNAWASPTPSGYALRVPRASKSPLQTMGNFRPLGHDKQMTER